MFYSQSVKTIEGYVVVNFEVASCGSFRDFLQRSFCDGEIGDGSDGINAICSRLEVISSEDEDAFLCYVCVNIWVVNFSSFWKN